MDIFKPITKLFFGYRVLTQLTDKIFTICKVNKSVSIDLFAYIQNVNCFVLCSSSEYPRPVNRVFYKKIFPCGRYKKNICQKITYDELERQVKFHPLDLTLFLADINSIIYIVPIYLKNNFLGFIRIISDIELNISEIINNVTTELNTVSVKTIHEIDPTLIAHIIGRLTAESYSLIHKRKVVKKRKKTIQKLLNIIELICPKGHIFFFTRNFYSDTLSFFTAASQTTIDILQNLEVDMWKDRHMFSLVARSGTSAIIKKFPEDLEASPIEIFRKWSPDQLYRSLTNNLRSNESFSYIGIPVRVDDNVVSVFAFLGEINNKEINIFSLFRFIRSVWSEFGRTVDKERNEKASSILSNFKLFEFPIAKNEFIASFSTKFIQRSLNTIWPEDKFNIGFLTSSTDEVKEVVGFKERVSSENHSNILKLCHISLETDQIILRKLKQVNETKTKAVLIIPLSSHESQFRTDIGCDVIIGNVDTLGSRSVLNVAKQFVATVNTSWSSAITRDLTRERIREYGSMRRQYDRMWATLHDLKNLLNQFFLGRENLYALLMNRSLNEDDLRKLIYEEIESFYDYKMKPILDRTKEAVDRTRIRQIEPVLLSELAQSTFKEALGLIQLDCEFTIDGDEKINTYKHDLQLVVLQIILNSLHNLAITRQKNPEICVYIKRSTRIEKEIDLIITDNGYKIGRKKQISSALNDSSKTLSSLIKKTTVRLLGSDIMVYGDDRNCGIMFHLPSNLSPR